MECGIGMRSLRNVCKKNKKPVTSMRDDGFVASLTTKMNSGGDEGIRTLDTSFGPYAPLAGECLRPLGHISMLLFVQITAECMMISFHSPSVNGTLAILKGSFLFCIEFVA